MDVLAQSEEPVEDNERLAQVSRLCRQHFNEICSVSVALVSRLGTQMFFFELAAEEASTHNHIGSLQLTDTGAGRAVLDADVVSCTDLGRSCSKYQDWRHFHSFQGAVAVVSIPLFSGGKVLGTLNLASTQAGSLKRRDPVLAEQAALVAPILARWQEKSHKRVEAALMQQFLPQHLRSDAAGAPSAAATAAVPHRVTASMLGLAPSQSCLSHAATEEARPLPAAVQQSAVAAKLEKAHLQPVAVQHYAAEAKSRPVAEAGTPRSRHAVWERAMSDDSCCSQGRSSGSPSCSAEERSEYVVPGVRFASKAMERLFLRWVLSGWQISVDISFCCITLCCFSALKLSWSVQLAVAAVFAVLISAALLAPKAAYCFHRENVMAGVRFVRTAVWCLEAQRLANETATSAESASSLIFSGTLVLLLEAFGCQMRIHKHLVVQSVNLAVVLAVSLRLATEPGRSGRSSFATCLGVQLGLGLLLPSLVLLSVEQSLRRRFIQSQCKTV